MSESPVVRVSFVDLPVADQATFKRVITFCAARNQHFELTDAAQADVLITDDSPASLQTAEATQTEQLLLVISNDQDCNAGDLQLQRPLLVTRVMRTMEQLSKQLASKVPAATKTDTSSTPQLADTAPPPSALRAVDEKAPETETTQSGAGEGNSDRSYLALVIDDSAAIRKQLEIELRTSGIRSEFAASGEEALEKIVDQQYDLIFLDIMMPGIDGYDTCGHIRKDPRYKKTPVIMLSGKTTPLDEVKGVIAGASTYLTKPVSHQQFQEVTQRITRWLDEFRQ